MTFCASMQSQILCEAAECLQKCQALEASLFESAQLQPSQPKRSKPQQPLLLNRTDTSVIVSHSPFRLRGAVPSFFAVYCKIAGSGVALSINKTATEYEGCGVLTPVGSSISVQNLTAREKYVFAIAAFDSQRCLVGELGAPQSASPAPSLPPSCAH
jgi:hypothetical protein